MPGFFYVIRRIVIRKINEMKKLSLSGKDLRKLGYPESRVIGVAIQVMHQYYKHSTETDALDILKKVLDSPGNYLQDAALGKIAATLLDELYPKTDTIALSQKRRDYTVYGAENIEMGAIHQMEVAMKLPVSVAGSLMPDAHQGYGLPIGGVLAADHAVIPYAVGVDIGCRMCLSIFDMPADHMLKQTDQLKQVLLKHTVFGAGGGFDKLTDHEVLNRKEFAENKFLKSLQGKAIKQIGSSGSGNHFVEFGIVEVKKRTAAFDIEPGNYTALLSHSGSRGLGAAIANYYTRVAKEVCKLPDVAQHLAYLDLNSEAGMEYWIAMNLSGDYASACHHQIHQKIKKALGASMLCRVENHHNFAWKEMYEGRELIVHRKGATPAGKGVAGIIPGSMTTPGYIVEGKGEIASLNSASHGAGRRMSRTAAKNTFTKKMLEETLQQAGVTLIGGDIDEAPMAYKDIDQVMQFQNELVDITGVFKPKVVRMDGATERSWR